MRGRTRRKFWCAVLGLLLMAACNTAPATVSNPSGYHRIGVLPTYEPEIGKGTAPGLFDNAMVEHFDLDLGLNQLVVDRVRKAIGQGREIVDLQTFAATYTGTPKVHTGGERKVFGDSRPLFTDVLRSVVGAQGLDAYVLIEGGTVGLYEPQAPPAIQIFAAQGHNLGVPLTIYVIDGRSFEVVGVARTNAVRRGVPDAWFVAPRQHVAEIKDAVVELLDQNLEPALRKLGLI
jgi:hypothetical protein